MAGIPRFYKKNIAEGGGILIYSILFAITIRIIYLINFDTIEITQSGGYLWDPISFLFSDIYISLATSSIITAALALLAAHINTKHLLIRHKSLLPTSVIVLLFSCHPSFIVMSAEYISALLFLTIINMLFTAYHSEQRQNASFKTNFVLACACLFTPISVIYFPILWISLATMRCLSVKSFMTSLVGIFIVFFPVFSFYLFTDKLDVLLYPFTSIDIEQISNFRFFSYNIFQWIILGFAILLLVIVIIDGYLNRHKDKIRVRAYINLLQIVAMFSFLAFIFLNIGSSTHLYTILVIGSLLIAHFFALAEKKITVLLFYLSLIFYTVICFSPFLSV
ncbi:MAG: hypothetical protein ACK5KT_17150 [Dysgonomonas sp.]